MRKRKGNNDLEYFTWDYIMSQTDSDGDVPGTFMACSRVRGPGKTYDIGRQMLKQRLGHPCKLAELIGTERLIGLIVRTKGAIGHTAQGVFGAVLADHYEGSFLKEIGISKAYSEIHWIFPGDGDDEDEDILLGYVIALNGRDEVKTNSSLFVDVGCLFFDEFIRTANDYQPDEVGKLIDIQNSIARGPDKSPMAVAGGVRYVPVFMAANCIDVDNPYFIRYHLVGCLQPDTILYRGRGVVYQRCDITAAISRQKSSRFNKAFEGDGYIGDSGWMMDDTVAICRPSAEWGGGIYSGTMVLDDTKYGVRWYPNVGIYYISYSVDPSYPYTYGLTLDGHPNVEFIRSTPFFKDLRRAFSCGCVRFQNRACKNVMMQIIV